MNKFYPVHKRFRRPLVLLILTYIGTIRTKEGKNLFLTKVIKLVGITA